MIPDIDRQIDAMRRRWPAWRVLERGLDWALWLGCLRPTSADYDVRMRYRVPLALENVPLVLVQPQVTVDGLTLKGLPRGVEPPHLYPPRPGNGSPTLCLFDPVARPVEWSTGDLLADTTVHWIGQWLVFFEGWLVTGRWYGGGRHPGAAPSA